MTRKGRLGYIQTEPPPEAQQGGARKYEGEVAQGYDAKREGTEKYKVEQGIIEDMLSDLPGGSHILDCPVGTGRFIELYAAYGFMLHGVDLSADMLRIAGSKVPETLRLHTRFYRGSILALPERIKDKSMDAAVMCRLTRWLSPIECQQALKELMRVTKGRIIFTARVRNHPHARPIELFEQVMGGWHVHRNEAGYVDEYRIIEIRPDE